VLIDHRRTCKTLREPQTLDKHTAHTTLQMTTEE
jgi:hypothetical protein